MSCSCLVVVLCSASRPKSVFPPSPGHRLLWLSLPWRRLCHWSTSGDSAEPWGREKCMQILLQLNMLSRRLKYISRGSKYCQTARDKTPGMYACKAAPILGDLFVLFVGRQPQTWDCRWTIKPKDFQNNVFPPAPPFQSWGVKGYP